MVNYSDALKLPFTSLQRAGLLFLLILVAGLPSDLAQVFQKKMPLFALGFGLANFLAVSFALAIVSVVLYIAIMGYSVRLTGYAAHGKNIMPPFEKPLSLLTSGLKYLLAFLLYALPLVISIVLSLQLLKDAVPLKLAGLVLLSFSVILGILWAFFMLYCGPMLMAHFAFENRFAAFFELGRILKYSFTLAYFVPWVVALGYTIVLAIPLVVLFVPLALIAQVSPIANILTSLLSALYTVILTPTVSSLYGQAYRGVKGGLHGEASAAQPGRAKRHTKRVG